MRTFIVLLSFNGRYFLSGPHAPEHKEMWLSYHRKWGTVLYAVNVKLKTDYQYKWHRKLGAKDQD